MTSKAERRRRRISLPGGDIVEHRATQGRRTDLESPKDAREVALKARERVFGASPTQDSQRASGGPLWGCAVGRAILTEPESARADLWGAVYHARRTQLAFDRAIGSPNRHAQVLRILAPTDMMRADAATPALDTRGPEDRVRQATRAQMQVEGWIGHCDRRAMSAYKMAVIDDTETAVKDWPGVRNCLMCIVEGLRGGKVIVRVRK